MAKPRADRPKQPSERRSGPEKPAPVEPVAPELTADQRQRLGEVLTVLDREQPDSFVRLSRWCEGFQNADEFVLGRDAVWEPSPEGTALIGRDFVSPVAPAFHQAFVGHLSRLGADDAAKSFPLTAPLHLKRQIPENLCYVIGRARRLCKELETRAGGLSFDIEPVSIPCDEPWESVRTLDEFQTWLNRRIVEVEQLLPAQRGHSQALSLWTAYWQAREWLTRHGHGNELPPLSEKLDDAYRWMQTRKGAAPDAMEVLRVMHDLLEAVGTPATPPPAAPPSGAKPVDGVVLPSASGPYSPGSVVVTMRDSVALRWFVHELRGLVMKLEMTASDEPEMVDGDFSVSVRDHAKELIESPVRFDEVSDEDIRRLEPSEGVRKAKRILRQMLESKEVLSVTLDEYTPALRKCLNSLPPVDAPTKMTPADPVTVQANATTDKIAGDVALELEQVTLETPMAKAAEETPAAETATKKEHSPWIDTPKLIDIMVDNSIRLSRKPRTSERQITRTKILWVAESQPGSNHRRFRFKLSILREKGVTYPADWDQVDN